MRIASVDGRLKVVRDGGAIDVEQASGGKFSSDPALAYPRFGELSKWAATAGSAEEPFDAALASCPVPSPTQIFAIGLNYSDHAAESGMEKPTSPVVFSKFQSSLAGATSKVVLPAGSVDWEVEVVAVIGAVAASVPVERGWEHVAGLSIGQDLSERELQRSGPAPQFSLAKSFRGFSPVGPCVVTPDEFDDPDDLELGCEVNGVVMQKGRTRDMIFSISEIVSYLSRIVTLFPGDLVFTGTPAGVGMGRTPPVYLKAGDVLESWVVGIGSISQTFVGGPVATER